MATSDRNNEETTWHFYRWSKDTWEAMISALESAAISIDFEQYYFVDLASGRIGGRFLDVLEKKARQGVRVRLLLDATGSWEFYVSTTANRLRAAGAQVAFHETLPLRDASRFFHSFLRDHRRLLVIDGAAAFVGGTAIKEAARMWRDTHVELRGGIVRALACEFDEIWKSVAEGLRHRQSALVARAGSWSVLPNGIRPSHRFIARFFLEGIRHAQKSIYVSTPYFAPNHQLFRALRLAALRGIDVRLLLPQRSDSRFAERAAESYYSGALRAGIRIFLYEPSFLHSKTIVIDDDWASVGSSNFDYLSMSFNYELNVLSYSSRFALEIKNHFFEDLQSAAEVMPEEWNGRFFLRKIFEKALIPLRIFV